MNGRVGTLIALVVFILFCAVAWNLGFVDRLIEILDGSPAPVVTVVPDAAKPKEVAKAEPLKPAPKVILPQFDVVRVEPSGDAVLAGTAAPNAKVDVLVDMKPVASQLASKSGEWALALDKPLAPGGHDLSLRATEPGSNTLVFSEQHVSVLVPQPGKGEVLVVVNQPGQPSRVLQVPGPESAKAAPVPAVDPKPEVRISAVEYEIDTLFISGSATGKGGLLAYLDDAKIAESVIAADGHFAVKVKGAVAPGAHKVRVDEVDEQGHVLARAEVPYDRQEEPMQVSAKAAAKGSSGLSGDGVGADGVIKLTIRPGDNLWKIATKLYGEGVRYSTIYQANSDQIRDPNLIYPGQVFLMPRRDENWKAKGGKPTQ